MEDLIEKPYTFSSGDAMIQVEKDVDCLHEELIIKVGGDYGKVFVDSCKPGTY
jgi:hypothetical protein